MHKQDQSILRPWRALFASAALLLAASATQAGVVWQQTDKLSSQLTGTPGYVTNGSVATVTYADQTATNTGPTAQHLGMYFGWNWIYDAAGGDTPLSWDNVSQAFVGQHVSLKVSRIAFGDQSLHLGDVLGDTWIGQPWAPGGETPIATEADWDAPLFDFGDLNAGESVNYGLQLTYAFDSMAALASFDSFGIYAQGVQLAVPEPGSLALTGFALFGIVWTRRRPSVR